ncbi:MAG: D-alanyl-D-alanine carboxypeptidase family protein [Patescibacteria group bacterium]|nr:D-alanyl-D-alanine carboxypeptidase family protein [Patescibacteria group bacterium]MDE1944011.1 D-alanyl-D-alanine carboxypeptidase family protein [Patescibacteria group bacterium]MDE1945157.1 D-alanyl-D-alanine carboxypeptidase family protein [Patescibacteria group bacterium]MDE2057997.1 D-alanyl-D-alanine carboxypeptidase family protein [Patescibacteria group bacterium]
MQTATTLAEYQNLTGRERRLSYLPERLATAYPIRESGEALVTLQDAGHEAGIELALAPIAPGLGVEDLKLRKEAAKRLVAAARELPEGIRFKIVEAYRPLAIQRQYFAEVSAEIARDEGLSGEALWERVTEFVADPALCPPHTTGGALDCTLVDVNGVELDMGSPLNAVDDRSYTDAPELSAEARKNRDLLCDTLLAAGFVNLPTEWWHYSYGDQYWAAFTRVPAALYGSLETG